MKSNKKQNKFNKVMGEFGKGTLKTSAGDKVTDRKQALAIAYSESELGENENINNKKMNKIKIKESELVNLVHSIVNRVIKEDIQNDEPFVAHGFYTLGNAGGYEIMLSNDGTAARVRDAFGSDNPETSDWLPIENVDNEDGEVDDEGYPISEPVIDPDGYDIPLSQVMRVNQFNESKQSKKIKIKESELRNLAQTIAKRIISEGVEDEEFISIERLIDIANKAGDYVLDAKDEIEELGVAYGDKIPTSRVVEVLHNYDLTVNDLYNEEDETYDWNFSINDGEKINRILQANNVDYEYRRDGDEIIFTFPTRDEQEKLFPLIKKAVENGELKLKGEGIPNYDWMHNDMFESKQPNKIRIKESELRDIIKKVVLSEINLNEKWKGDVEIKSTGEHAGKTIEQLQSELSALKKRSKKYQDADKKVPESIKDQEKEIMFAIRAKRNFKGGVKEDTSGMFAIEKPNSQVITYKGSYEEANAWVEKHDPDGMYDLNIRPVE